MRAGAVKKAGLRVFYIRIGLAGAYKPITTLPGNFQNPPDPPRGNLKSEISRFWLRGLRMVEIEKFLHYRITRHELVP